MLPENLTFLPQPQDILTIHTYAHMHACACTPTHTFTHKEKREWERERNTRNNAKKVIRSTLNN